MRRMTRGWGALVGCLAGALLLPGVSHAQGDSAAVHTNGAAASQAQTLRRQNDPGPLGCGRSSDGRFTRSMAGSSGQ